jgi:acyl-CoA hydrolase
MSSIESSLAAVVEPGMLVALADGPGAPNLALGPLSRVARYRSGVGLLLGWCLALPDDLELDAFAQRRSVMGGFALRELIATGSIEYLPVRLGAVPGLVGEHMRPDVLIVAVRPGAGGWELCSDVGWTIAAVRAGARLVGVVNHGLPVCSREEPFAWDSLTVLGEIDEPPVDVAPVALNDITRAVGRNVASLIRPEAVLQFGPGAVATATLSNIDVAVSVDSGLLSDDVVDLDSRGLLIGEPRATYLAGTSKLYQWANDRRILHRVELSHNIERLAARGLTAINAALEIDVAGQVNVEAMDGVHIAGIGGHPDFAAAASRAGAGLSIVALPSTRHGRPTLVDELSAPTSTARSDVDVVVNENGIADLRGLGDRRRRLALRAIWG